MTRIALALLLALGLLACAAEAETERTVTEFVLEEVRDAFDSEEHIANPARAQVADDNRYFVVDGAGHRVLVLSPKGELLHTIGRQGEGPGEFAQPPGSLIASRDSVFVMDGMRALVHSFSADGTYSHSRDLDTGAMPWNVSLTSDGHVALSREGFGDHLAVWVTPDGESIDVGALVAPSVEVYDMAAMKSEIDNGKVPAAFRNSVLPVFADSETLWLILQGEGLIRSHLLLKYQTRFRTSSSEIYLRWTRRTPHLITSSASRFSFSPLTFGKPRGLPTATASTPMMRTLLKLPSVTKPRYCHLTEA